MIKNIKKFWRMHIIRYALVGGIGIPIHDIALAGFLALMSMKLYPVALVCAFEVSTTINFFLNQWFTYREQVRHLTLWGWVKRAAKGQLTSLSALLVSLLIALICTYLLHLNPLISSPVGIIGSFTYNYFISKRFVFQPTTAAQPTENAAQVELAEGNAQLSVQSQD